MDISNKKTRADLKKYFVKNAIPTESNFADFIDAMVSQRDDGLARPAGEPVSIEASSAGARPALKIYEAFTDTAPQWTLSLVSDTTTQKRGLVVSDVTNKPRLTIDRTSGDVGVGSLSVSGAINANGGLTVPMGQTLQVPGTLSCTGSATLNAVTVPGTLNCTGSATLNTLTVPGALSVTGTGAVTVRKDLSANAGPVLTLFNGGGAAGAGGAIDFNGYDPGTQAASARIRSQDDGVFSSHLVVYTKDPGANTNALKERFRVQSGGGVIVRGAVQSNALVARRVLYGFAGHARIDYSTTFTAVTYAYAPFGYAMPGAPAGATRKYRLYLIYSDNMNTSGNNEIRFRHDDGQTFTLPYDRTWGEFGATARHRDFMTDWIPTISGAHAAIEVRTNVAGMNGSLYYLEVHAWDFYP